MFDLLAPFIIGWVGSLHCLGMCGPLVVAYGLHLRNNPAMKNRPPQAFWKTGFFHHLFFHAGRVLTYGLLGLSGALLFHMAGVSLLFKDLRGGVTLVAGLLMVFMGLVLLRWLPMPRFLGRSWMNANSFPGRFFHAVFRSPRLGSKLALGLATGFLPCGLSWAMVLKAASTQNAPLGFFTMVAFGLGTVPALLVTGFSASFFSLRMRLAGEKIAGLSVIVMGVVLVFKGGRTLV
jgi:uncharacterized protein